MYRWCKKCKKVVGIDDTIAMWQQEYMQMALSHTSCGSITFEVLKGK